MLTDFRDFAPDPVASIRPSNPFAAAVVGSLTTDDLAEFEQGMQRMRNLVVEYYDGFSFGGTVEKVIGERTGEPVPA